jgi:hypothetical protein
MKSCGAELAEDAVVPERLAALMSHVAENLLRHAGWVGSDTTAAAMEQRALARLAAEYQAIASAAVTASVTMRGLQGLEFAPHDPAKWDRNAFATWVRQKIELQRQFAQLLLEHAERSERALFDEWGVALES